MCPYLLDFNELFPTSPPGYWPRRTTCNRIVCACARLCMCVLFGGGGRGLLRQRRQGNKQIKDEKIGGNRADPAESRCWSKIKTEWSVSNGQGGSWYLARSQAWCCLCLWTWIVKTCRIQIAVRADTYRGEQSVSSPSDTLRKQRKVFLCGGSPWKWIQLC